MAQNAVEIDGSPFTEETTIARALTEEMQYFSATDGSTYPDDTTDPGDPADPTGQDGNGDKSGGGAQTGDDGNGAVWAALAALAAAAAVMTGLYRKKQKA